MKKQVCIFLLFTLLPITPLNATPFEWDAVSEGNSPYSERGRFKQGIATPTEAENIIDSLDFWLDDLDGAKLGGTDQGGEGSWQWLNTQGEFSFTSWQAHPFDGVEN